MNSKEALQELFIRVGGYRDNEEYTTSRVREIIMKDLEVLEILTKYDVLSVIGNDEDYEKVKWYIVTHKKLENQEELLK